MRKLFLLSFLCIATTAISLAQLKVLSNGNVGIGTTTPGYKLTLGGTGNIFGVENTATFLAKNASGSYEQYFYPRWSDNIMYMNYGSAGFNIRNNSYTSTMFMTNDGKVGVGTTAPLLKFDIRGSSAKATSTAFTNYFQIASTDASNPLTLRMGIKTDATTTNRYAALEVDDAGTKRALALQPTSGDVLVGTNTSSNQGKVYIYQTISDAGLRVYKTNATPNSYNIVSQVSGSNVKSFATQYGGNDKFVVFGDGDVNINCNYHDTTYKLIVWGSAYANGLWQSSDFNFKQNITEIVSPIDKLNLISGKKYEYNTAAFPERNFPTGYTYGVIAQEVQAVLPELVQADSAGYLAVNYDGLIPILIEAVKSQQITIKEQEVRIDTLETNLAKCCTGVVPSDKSLQVPNDTNNNENGSVPALYQNIPNPFNVKTVIGYYLPNETTNASLLIFDMQGKLIKTYKISTFEKANIEINAGELQPGMYMYSLIANGKEVDTKKMILTE